MPKHASHLQQVHSSLTRGEEMRGGKSCRTTIQHRITEHMISALEICNHKEEQRLLMFKSSKCSFQIRIERGTKRQT